MCLQHDTTASNRKILTQLCGCNTVLLQFIYDAATRIQKVYRGRLARREFAKMAAKNKKGKKGGKKGGKKK